MGDSVCLPEVLCLKAEMKGDTVRLPEVLCLNAEMNRG